VSATPDSGPDLRCSPWTLAQGVDPIGTAPVFDHLLLVEWPLPWPSDIGEIPALAAAAADPRATVMAVVPHGDGEQDGLRRVVHHRRTGTHRLAGVDHRVAPEEVPDLLGRLLEDLDAEHLDWPSAVGPSERQDVLVCGHGRRDPCCGRFGTLLHVELTAAVPEARVWRCSHTGGHRFAPTALTVGDGRAWAYADVELVAGVLQRSVPVADLHGRDRGTAALGPWGQALERAVFEHVGWPWLDTDLAGQAVELAEDRRSARVSLAWHDPDGAAHRAEGDVVVTRDVPVLVCGEPPEAAKKSSLELAVTRLEVDGHAVTLPPRGAFSGDSCRPETQ
jgi:hypothetical protein